MNKILILALLSSLILVVVNSQSSPSNCTFNGFNYSNLKGISFSSKSPNGYYEYYFQICGEEMKKCLNTGFAACTKDISRNALYLIGSLAQSSFSTNSNGNTVLTYKTNTDICSNYNYRSIDIELKCATGPLVISNTVENPLCKYTVTIQGADLCKTL